MKPMIRLLGAATILLTASAALAVQTLATPPMNADFGGTMLECTATNASPSSHVTMQIEVLDYVGHVVDSTSTFDLAPENLGALTASSNVGAASCLFRVVSGSAKNLRAAADYFGPNWDLVIVPAK